MPEQETQQPSTEQTQNQEQDTLQQDIPQQDAPQQEKPQQDAPQQEKPQQSTRKTNQDRIAELESKIARMEAIYQLQGQNVVDMEVCTDLLMKGYTLEQLKQSKPYLFSNSVNNSGVVKQPPKVVAGTQTPKSPLNVGGSSESFVKTLADMLISKF